MSGGLPRASSRLVLLTGATGYVGAHLLRTLESRGVPVRCLARRPAHMQGRVAASTSVAAGDLLDPASLSVALEGVDTAVYLVHSMGASGDFREQDRRAAHNFAHAARAHGVRRIVYLGGLGDDDAALSPHLASRHEVGRILLESGTQVVELRASIVLGAGSLSFELIRALVERLPVMITPRWVEVLAQPIAISDLIDFLVAAIDARFEDSRVIEIGGPERISYGGLMREYARQRGLRRLMIRVPVLTPHLSSLWLGLVTPIYARVGKKLVESMRHETVVRRPAPAAEFGLTTMNARAAIATTLRDEERAVLAARWCDAVSSARAPVQWKDARFGARIVDTRSVWVAASPAQAFAPIARIGGRTGWYGCGWLWRARGALDLVLGGVGMRRGRRDPSELRVGDPLDFWRVEEFEPGRRLRLAAEMKVPGRAWLEFEVEPETGGARIRQTALFDPVGLGGLAYWYALLPLHAIVFRRMLHGIARSAARSACA
ncbi:MAG: SDR family oxidoreductase [Planctomycetota bacterium]